MGLLPEVLRCCAVCLLIGGTVEILARIEDGISGYERQSRKRVRNILAHRL